MTLDLVVVGGGPGGYAAALEGARAGMKVALVERDRMGGTCLNWGCIPTKLFLGATEPVQALEAQSRMRVASGEVNVDLSALQVRKQRLLPALGKAMGQRLEKSGIEFYQGIARMDSGRAVEVLCNGKPILLPFEHCVLATGSRPFAFPGMEVDGQAVLNSDQALDLKEAPETLIIVGGGVIGLEVGQFFSRLGTKIILVEAMDRLAPFEDAEIGLELGRVYKRRKWDLHLGKKVQHLATSGGRAVLTLESGEVIEADKALVAVGRRPNSPDLKLEKAGIETTGPGWVTVNENLRASERVYAVGDVTGRLMLAHAAEHQARYVVKHMRGLADAPYDDSACPSCIYGSPEVMRVGAGSRELLKEGVEAEVSTFPIAANPIAQAHAETQGMVKVFWKNNKVCGVTGVGYGVSHLTTLATVMVMQGWSRTDLDEFIFPHPSIEEALLEACHAERKKLR
ncbi:MAG: dihydrolipoyl dehydrogenase family protein [Desulfovibrio sp.]|uniref:dihydrolipoyl dehydrogenase family protein n=1 Tax=Desulfovibrio sp. 7SRBS1 TaxID=3378064 RepID=UPI003B41CE6F